MTSIDSQKGPSNRVAVIFLFALVGLFLALFGFVESADGLRRIDEVGHDLLYGLIGPHEALMTAVTFFGNNATITTLVVVVALGLLLAKRLGLAVRVLVASGGGGLVVVSLKHLIQRARPLDTVIPADGFSFPSGHAFASTVFYGMMIYLVWRLTDRPWARALATGLGAGVILAVGLSRVYLNVHYLSDVAAGWAIGLAWLIASVLLVGAVERKSGFASS